MSVSLQPLLLVEVAVKCRIRKMHVGKAIFLLYQLLLLCESCRLTGVPGRAPEKRREAKVSLPIAVAPYWELPTLH